MTTVLKDFKEVFISRVKNMLVVNFIIAWSIYNYEITLTVLFKEINIDEKIKYLEGIDFILKDMLFIPLCIALIYIYLIPLINLGLTMLYDKIVNEYIDNHKNKKLENHYNKQEKVQRAKLRSSIFLERQMDLELQERQQQLAKEKQELTINKDNFERLEKEKKELEKENRDVYNENDLLHEKVKYHDNLKKEYKNLETKLNTVTNDNNKLHKDINELKIELEKSKKELVRIQEKAPKFDIEKEYSEKFDKEEIKMLNTIYTKDITEKCSYNAYVQTLKGYLGMPTIKIEKILESLIKKNCFNTFLRHDKEIDSLEINRETKDIIYKMFK